MGLPQGTKRDAKKVRGGAGGVHLDTAPIWKGFGAAMSSSPWERLWKGDEDVATPFLAGAVSRCARAGGGGEAGGGRSCVFFFFLRQNGRVGEEAMLNGVQGWFGLSLSPGFSTNSARPNEASRETELASSILEL